MHIREVYYRQHLRSLFISRFNYSAPTDVDCLEGLKIRATVDTGSYELLSLFLFFISYRWPLIARKGRYRVRGKYFLKGLVDYSKTNRFYIYRLIQNFKILYFPLLDGSVGELDFLFERKTQALGSSAVPLSLGSVLYIFPEFDFLTQYSYSLLRQYAAAWRLVFLFEVPGLGEVSRVNLLRALGCPFMIK